MRPRVEVSHDEVMVFMELEYQEQLRDLVNVREMKVYRGWINPGNGFARSEGRWER